MWGWFNAVMARASLSKRSPNSTADTLMATMRSRRVSRAFHPSPIPPEPSGARISYDPKRIPAEIAIIGELIKYNLRIIGSRPESCPMQKEGPENRPQFEISGDCANTKRNRQGRDPVYDRLTIWRQLVEALRRRAILLFLL